MISCLQRGEGEPLVFLHGYLSRKESFSPQIAYFSRFYRVTALDFPGMGDAEPLPSAWSVGDYADWTAELLARCGAEGARVVAHSFGGRVAVKLLARGMFSRAVLTGCAGIVRKRTLRYRLRVRTYWIVKKFAPAYAERAFGSAEYRTLSPVMRESYKKIVNEDLRGEAEKISRPVLFLHGGKDRTVPLSSIEVYLGRVRDSRLVLLPDCGHFAFLDDPLAFNLATEEFLK